jgi:hypothetical protein
MDENERATMRPIIFQERRELSLVINMATLQ